MMGPGSLFEPARPRFGVRLAATAPPRLTPARKRVLDVVADGQVRAKPALAAEAKCSTGVIDGLIAAGTLVEVAIPERGIPVPNAAYGRVDFAGAQAQAVHAVDAAAGAETFSVTLLDGVTGSGKTEVYFEAVARTLSKGAQALIMLPEIALTSQFMDRFARRFGCMPVEWHSALSPAERARAWRAAASGEARVVVGARSALFLPYRELGLIVVDEEHDQGFKQEDRVHYQARDMAIVRASLGKFAVILASATPSIESHVNARTGRYRLVELPGRFSGAKLPDVLTIDMRKEPPAKDTWLATSLVTAVTETLAQGQQTLLFLNRRGYAPLTLCRCCGHRLDCPQCTAWLVEHRYRHRLNCHHCGFAVPIPQKCPKCGAAESLVACGPGVERIAEEVGERFPEARVALLSSDLVPSLVEMRQIIGTIESGAVDIVIGTQMVAKGHHFPRLATVGVVDADLGLGTADPRAAERTFQLLHQVTGRAGRVLACGRGLVQTYLPEHPVMQAIISGDRNRFLESEIRQRQTALLPPYGRLAALIVSARDKELAALVARELAQAAPTASRIEVLGPAEAPLAVIRGRHRWRLLVKAPRELDIQGYLRLWLGSLRKLPSDVRLTVDIDPYSFL
jgi:primosomal protein N' (replication factor Y) (superfamily II helicase)